jgi:hypothetical protein
MTRTRIFLATEITEEQEDFFDRLWAELSGQKAEPPLSYNELRKFIGRMFMTSDKKRKAYLEVVDWAEASMEDGGVKHLVGGKIVRLDRTLWKSRFFVSNLYVDLCADTNETFRTHHEIISTMARMRGPRRSRRTKDSKAPIRSISDELDL